MKENEFIKIYTDGSCIKNPGPGGWAAILIKGAYEKVISGKEKHTTNNQMELRAAIEAFKALNYPSKVLFYSDSKYVLRGMTEWLENWIKNNWKTKNNKSVANKIFWEELMYVSKKHQITWNWIRGHSGHHQNERADRIARIEAESL